MKRLVNTFGTMVFWVCWPIIHISVRLQPRTRVLVICQQEVLVVMDLIGPGRWALPGGGVHRRESAVDGAVRELREETGISIAPSKLLNQGLFETVNDEHHHYKYHFFVVEFDEKPAVKKQMSELRDLKWMHYKALLSDKRTGSVVTERVAAWFDH